MSSLWDQPMDDETACDDDYEYDDRSQNGDDELDKNNYVRQDGDYSWLKYADDDSGLPPADDPSCLPAPLSHDHSDKIRTDCDEENVVEHNDDFSSSDTSMFFFISFPDDDLVPEDDVVTDDDYILLPTTTNQSGVLGVYEHQLNPQDVVCGLGPMCNHPGNLMLRDIALSYAHDYYALMVNDTQKLECLFQIHAHFQMMIVDHETIGGSSPPRYVCQFSRGDELVGERDARQEEIIEEIENSVKVHFVESPSPDDVILGRRLSSCFDLSGNRRLRAFIEHHCDQYIQECRPQIKFRWVQAARDFVEIYGGRFLLPIIDTSRGHNGFVRAPDDVIVNKLHLWMVHDEDTDVW